MNKWVYAPQPIEAYTGLMLPAIQKLCQSLPVWNMYYLSTPELDEIRVLTQEEQMARAKSIMLVNNPMYLIPNLAEALIKKPSELRGFVTDTGLGYMDAFVGEGWWQIFDARLARAEKAGIVYTNNVVQVDFKRRTYEKV